MLYSSRKTKKTIKNACNDRIMNRQQKGADLMKNIEWKDKVASFKKIEAQCKTLWDFGFRTYDARLKSMIFRNRYSSSAIP